MRHVNSFRIEERKGLTLFLLILISILTVQPLLTICGILFPFLAFKFLWRTNEPPILFLAFILQWVQVTVKIFYADFYSLPLEQVYEFPTDIVQAYYLSLLGLSVQCLGIWIVLKNVPTIPAERISQVSQQYNLKKVTVTYLMAIFLYPLLTKFSFSLGGLQQFIQKIVELKWSLFFLLYALSFLKRKNMKVFYLIMLIEITLSFSGYFSSFKDYFLFFGMAYIMFIRKFRLKHYMLMLVMCFVCFNLFVVWQHVKPEYRRFLSGGQRSQNVTVSRQVALDKLVGLVYNMDTTAYRDGVMKLVDRTTYIDYFSASIAHVPKIVNYENGKLWWNAFVHVFTPRILFPGKPSIDDSETTSRYTGLKLAGAAEGTSITLGYTGETYVDFGIGFMFVPLFVFGLVVGKIYYYVLYTSTNELWGMAFIFPLFFQLQAFEMGLNKMLGGVIAYILVLLFTRKYLIPRLDRFLKNNS